MAINKLVSIKIPILEAGKNMGIDITRDKPTFAMWAVQAEKDIGSYYSYKRKRAVLTISGCRAELPCNAAYLKGAFLGDHGCDCGELFQNFYNFAAGTTPVISSNQVYLLIDKPDTNQSFAIGNISWEIQDNNLLFSNNLDGQKITIEYLGLEEDCDGFVMCNENHIPAIIEFIMWKYCVRSRFSPNKMELGDTMMHQKEYNRLVSDARAMDAELTDAERAEIVAMLHDPHSGHGLDIGINPNSYSVW